MLFGTLGVVPVDPSSFYYTGSDTGSDGDGAKGAKGMQDRQHYTVESGRVTVAPGQTLRIPLEIVMEGTEGTEGQLPYIPCHKSHVSIEVTSDLGEQQVTDPDPDPDPHSDPDTDPNPYPYPYP